MENTKLDEDQQGEPSVNSMQKTTDEHEYVSSALLSGLSATQNSKGNSSLPQTTGKTGTTSKRTPSASKRLLAPSFFSKKS